MENPEQSRALLQWWQSRGRAEFHSKTRLACHIGVSRRTVNAYFSGQIRPQQHHAAKLHEVTELRCFSLDSQIPEWARVLTAQSIDYIHSLPVGDVTSRRYSQFVSRILRRLVQAGVSRPEDVTLQTAIQNPPGYRTRKGRKISTKMDREALRFFGRAMAAVGVFTADQHRTFVKILKLLYPQRAPGN